MLFSFERGSTINNDTALLDGGNRCVRTYAQEKNLYKDTCEIIIHISVIRSLLKVYIFSIDNTVQCFLVRIRFLVFLVMIIIVCDCVILYLLRLKNSNVYKDYDFFCDSLFGVLKWFKTRNELFNTQYYLYKSLYQHIQQWSILELTSPNEWKFLERDEKKTK